MASPIQPDDLQERIRRGHEPTRFRSKPAVIALIVFIVFAAVVHLLLALIYAGLAKTTTRYSASPLSNPALAIPPEPRLQPSPAANSPVLEVPAAEMRQLRLAEEKRLNETAVVPIEQAMRQVADRLDLQGTHDRPSTPIQSPYSPDATGGHNPFANDKVTK